MACWPVPGVLAILGVPDRITGKPPRPGLSRGAQILHWDRVASDQAAPIAVASLTMAWQAEKMGRECGELEADQFRVVTNKVVRDLRSSMMWLVAGQGSPRRYSPCARFTVGDVGPAEGGEFRHVVSGKRGTYFGRWSPSMKRSGSASFSTGRFQSRASRDFATLQHGVRVARREIHSVKLGPISRWTDGVKFCQGVPPFSRFPGFRAPDQACAVRDG